MPKWAYQRHAFQALRARHRAGSGEFVGGEGRVFNHVLPMERLDGSGSTIKEGSYVCSGLRYWQPQFHLRWFMARAPKIRMALSTRPRTCKALRRRQPRLTYRMRILLTCPTEALTDVIGSNQPLTHTESLVNG